MIDKKYVEADQLQKGLRELCEKYNISFGSKSKGFGADLAVLSDTLTAADVRLKKYGKWLGCKYDYRDRYFEQCSVCGQWSLEQGNFCPHCGAEME